MGNSAFADILINLIAAFSGFLIAQTYNYLRKMFSRKTTRWFWSSKESEKICLYPGFWRNALSDEGELEPIVNAQDALTLGELRVFLERLYSEVVIVTREDAIDWQAPVVSLGGPLPNSLTKSIGEKGLLPIWFLDMPYSRQSKRVIGTNKRTEVFRPEFNENGQLITDVGFVARIRSLHNEHRFLYIIASCYGVGNLGIVKFLTSSKKLKQLRRMGPDPCFQAVIRSFISDNKIIEMEMLFYKRIH